MATLYKITDASGYTRRGEHNECKWGENVTHQAVGSGGLCTNGVIHAYEHPLIASFMNPAHAAPKSPLLWECKGEVALREGQLKCGCKSLTTLRQIDLPLITRDQRVRIAIYCALSQYSEPSFVTWATGWLDGSDRSAAAAREAAAEATATAEAEAEARAAEAWAAAEAEFDLLAILKSVVLEGK